MDKELVKSFQELVSEKAGLRQRGQDAEMLCQAVLARIKRRGFHDPGGYLKLLEGGSDDAGQELTELTSLLTVGESFFFRDKGQFALLKYRILPGLIESKKAGKRLRIWSAGCSTGEEPYSIAILVDELLPGREGWDISIIGTDIKEEYLAKARKGEYGQWSFRAVDPLIREGYFKKTGDRWAIEERIRRMVMFLQGDIFRDELPDYARGIHDMDLIICRNVFIYYTRRAISRIIDKLSDALAKGGYLMAGHGELYSVPTARLKPRLFPESLIYEKSAEAEQASSGTFARLLEGASAVFTRNESLKAPVSGHSAPARHRAEVMVEDPSRAVSEARDLFRCGAYRETIEHLKDAIDRGVKDFDAVFLAASSYANLGEHGAASDLLRKAVSMNRFAVEPYYLMAHIAEENGDAEEAEGALKKVIYLNPEEVRAYLELASIYDGSGDASKARKMRLGAMELLKTRPGDFKVAPYENTTVKELMDYLRRTLEAEPGQ